MKTTPRNWLNTPHEDTTMIDSKCAHLSPVAIPASLWAASKVLPRRKPTDDEGPWPVLDDSGEAVIEMLACQIAQTGFCSGGRRPTADERDWAVQAWEESQARTAARRVSGTCSGCNSIPCRCLA